jgi:DNA-binding beta-propeller fold protein YncE
MFRLPSPTRTCSGAKGRLWIAVATVAVLLVAAAPAQGTPFAYVTQHRGEVSQYDVGAGGLLAPMSPATVAAGPEPGSVAVSPDGESVYVTNQVGWHGSISQYDVGPGGELSPKSPATVPAADMPGSVTVSPDGQSVYVANNWSDNSQPPSSTVSQYDVGPGGELSPKSPATVPAGAWPYDVAVSPDGESVYVTDGFSPDDTFDVRQYDVGPGGELSPKSPATVDSGGGEPIAVAVSPDGESVYVTNLCAERTNICLFDDPHDPSPVAQFDVGPGGELSPKSPATVAVGEGAGSVTVSPDGQSVYVTGNFLWDGEPGYIFQYDVGPGGELSPKSPAKVVAGEGASSVTVTSDGQSVYVVNGRDGDFTPYGYEGSLSQYDVGPGGALSPKSPATVPTAPDPEAMAVSPGAQPPLTCSNFGSQARAQSFFLDHGGPRRDRHALDGDNDGLACEARGAPYRGLLKVKYRAGHFKGRLKAVTGSCRGDRRIEVYKERSGANRLFGKDRTKNRGFYRVQKNRPSNGKVYAKSRSEGNCRKDRSFRTIRF